jgi:hypothetical protein
MMREAQDRVGISVWRINNGISAPELPAPDISLQSQLEQLQVNEAYQGLAQPFVITEQPPIPATAWSMP